MPLYLDEINFNISSKSDLKRAYELIQGAMTKGFPPGVTLKAGPWVSNEDAKIILVLDIQDHSLTFDPFTGALAGGMISKRRLTPIVDWNQMEKTAGR
ncbi:MAG: hypothetical protein ACREQE_09735 [Candidatus Binataceae bacterium]